jgi:hypothetical protein
MWLPTFARKPRAIHVKNILRCEEIEGQREPETRTELNSATFIGNKITCSASKPIRLDLYVLAKPCANLRGHSGRSESIIILGVDFFFLCFCVAE